MTGFFLSVLCRGELESLHKGFTVDILAESRLGLGRQAALCLGHVDVVGGVSDDKSRLSRSSVLWLVSALFVFSRSHPLYGSLSAQIHNNTMLIIVFSNRPILAPPSHMP